MSIQCIPASMSVYTRVCVCVCVCIFVHQQQRVEDRIKPAALPNMFKRRSHVIKGSCVSLCAPVCMGLCVQQSGREHEPDSCTDGSVHAVCKKLRATGLCECGCEYAYTYVQTHVCSSSQQEQRWTIRKAGNQGPFALLSWGEVICQKDFPRSYWHRHKETGRVEKTPQSLMAVDSFAPCGWSVLFEGKFFFFCLSQMTAL